MDFIRKRFLSGGKEKDKPTTNQTIQKLRETEEMLIKKQEILETNIAEQLDIAKKNIQNKRGLVF